MIPTPVTTLTQAQAADVRALAAAAAHHDGVPPLSEAYLLRLDRPNAATHLLDRGAGGGLAAYGQVAADGAAELVVHPDARGAGRGRGLLTAAAAHGARAVWAHGDLPAARALAERLSLPRTRLLLKLVRELGPADASAPDALPDGFVIDHFRPGDEADWLRVNAAAFASHPEQGRVTRPDFDRLTRQPWFDPSGLILLRAKATGDLVGFHWTKIDPAEIVALPGGGRGPAGEVYVVGLAPEVHGRGLAGPLTAAGLRHLAARGLPAVVLYVESDNLPALATYRKAGFTDLERHASYAVGTMQRT